MARDFVAEVDPGLIKQFAGDEVTHPHLPTIVSEVYGGNWEDFHTGQIVTSLYSLFFSTKESNEARSLADSHRDYGVAVAVEGYSLEEGIIGTQYGYNIKPEAEGEVNYHAEAVAIRKAREVGITAITAMSLVADPEDLDANPEGAPTIRPCRQRCIGMLLSPKTPETGASTVICSANPDMTRAEIYTAGQLDRHYQTSDNVAGPVNGIGVIDLNTVQFEGVVLNLQYYLQMTRVVQYLRGSGL